MKTKTVLAIDPGNVESAYVLYNGKTILEKGKVLNDRMLYLIKYGIWPNELLIEMISSYGMAVGQTTFDTCVWIGRFFEEWEDEHGVKPKLVFRKTIKMHHCGSVKAKDGEVNQALKDKYGIDHTKKNPNEFYRTDDGNRMNGDIWSALALATYYFEPKDYPIKNIQEREENKITSNLL